MSKSKVLFIMTGSIACYKACHVVSRLVQNNCEVQVVASPSALKFVGNATLEGLTGKPVVSDMYAPGNVMDHIHLMRWADLILVAPATASFLNKAAQGAGDDLIQTLFLAHDFKKPFLVAPAMNASMYLHPITQKSVKTLRDLGIEILDTASGILACGEEGWGKLLEPDLILKFALDALKKSAVTVSNHQESAKPFKNIKVLITAGGTQEPIDTVRTISNLSSGRTGVAIADHLHLLGFDVTLLRAHSATKSTEGVRQEVFTDFQSLDQRMHHLLANESYSHVIHTAAVSDYSVDSLEIEGQKFSPLEQKKVNSDTEHMSIHLRRNHKIVNRLKDYSQNKNLKVVAFKLTSHADEEKKNSAVQKLFAQAHADFVVHNDLTDIDIVNKTHKFTLFDTQNKTICEGLDRLKNELVNCLLPKELL